MSTTPSFFPIPDQRFPEGYKKKVKMPDGTEGYVFLEKSYPCQACERSFKLVEHHPTDKGKKSKSWAVGFTMWGRDNPSMVETFIIKCPQCGDAVMMLPLSRRTSLDEAIKKAPAPNLTPPTKVAPGAQITPIKKPSK